VRVFLDTNVLVSAVATRGICADVLRIALADHEVVISEQVLTELRRALTEKLRVTEGLVEEIDELLRREADVVVDDAPKLEVTIRDEDDVGIVEQAVAGAADVLVTGDQDLIEMGEDRPIRVLTPRGFWDLLRSELAEPE
jgi:putative PIN family toxin of toxin-antitoxin system